MTISFDLDDTLIPGTKQFETEPQGFFQKLFGIERIRIGTIELIRNLQAQGHTVFIYTTSMRSKRKLRRMFFSYGIRVGKIINQQTHETTLGSRAKEISKFPPAFGIDIHIDDSRGVKIEGTRNDFKTIIIEESNSTWTEFILQTITGHTASDYTEDKNL